MITVIPSQDALLAYRETHIAMFEPGSLVKVAQHGIADSTFSNIWLHNNPGSQGADCRGTEPFKTAPPALVIALQVPNRSNALGYWLLLLFANGDLGWTDEIEGLNVLVPPHV